MNGYIAFLKKEWMENTRNYKLFLILALFLIFGMLSPITAKFLPQLITTLVTDMDITMPEPTALDSWTQFYKNVSQLGFSLTLIIFSSFLSSEYSKGTLINMLTKGLSRSAVIASKLTVAGGIMTVSYWLAFAVTYAYTVYFWPDTVIAHTILAAVFLWINGLFYLSILMLGCVLFRQAFPSVIFLLGVTTFISLVTIPKALVRYSPFILITKHVDLLAGKVALSEFTIPLVITLVMTVGIISLSIFLFKKKQL